MLTTTGDLPAAEVALAHRGSWRVEQAFRTLKTPLEIRQVYHHSEAGVRGHMLSCVLAFVLVRLLEERLAAAGVAVPAREALARLASIERVPVRLGKRSVSRVRRPSKEQRALLKAVGVRLPEA